MARCVISSMMDTDLPGSPLVAACVVHASYAPCMHNGEPAAAGWLHTWAHPSRTEVVVFWWRRTLGQRTLVMHFGPTDGPQHVYGDTAECWCFPELFPASPQPVPRPRPGSGMWPATPRPRPVPDP